MKILRRGTYYGTKKYELALPGILLSEYAYLSPQTDWHFHENPYFMYVIEGNLLDISKHHHSHCPPGSFLFHNWQEAHYNSKESAHAGGFHIEFDRAWFLDKQLDIELWEGSQLLADPQLHHLLAQVYFEFSCRDSYSQVAIEVLLLQLCEQIDQTRTHQIAPRPSWIDRLRDILQNPSQELSLDALSQELGIHPVHLSRSVPKYFNFTLGEYIRQQRIKSSIPYLLNSRYSLTEIAFLCGFSDQSHFTRTFKRYLCRTPRAFRKGLVS